MFYPLLLSFTQADLIHLGSKYSPCMKRNQFIEKGYKKDIAYENRFYMLLYFTQMLLLSFTQADLIHLGAKYSPCMRRDQGIEKGYKKDLEEERNSACCIRDDGSGCAQMSESRCSVSSQSGIL